MENGNLKIVKLAGGLGNQLFQVCFGQYLARTFGCKVRYFNEPGLRPLWAISALVPEIDYCTHSDLVECGYAFPSRLAYRIKRKACELFPWLDRNVMVETGSRYHGQIRPETRVFDGYWQSYRYLPQQLSFSFPDMALPHLEEIGRTNAVFVHLRRGDYLNKANQGIFAVCGIDYFERAIRQLASQLEQPVFYVFSNDMEWAKTHLKVPGVALRYIANEGEHADIVDFLEMTLCRHAIISNSTFSWWAAWLIGHPGKQVIAPKKWYQQEAMNAATKDLFPVSWTRI